MSSDLENLFPRLRGSDYACTSDRDVRYNCIAWAADDVERCWWPQEDYYWPVSLPQAATLESFRAAFEALGYAVCDSGEREDGTEKIAIYADSSGLPKHAARQLPDGRWTSKCGQLEDITHELDAFSGGDYGEVQMFLRRRRQATPSPVTAATPDFGT